MQTRHSTVTEIRAAGPDHQVVTVTSNQPQGGKHPYRREPCAQCPWRKDAVGVFPAEAFRQSASTAYDMSDRTFGCHDSGSAKPATCAGFLLHGAHHNLTIRMARMLGRVKDDVTNGGHKMHQSYRDMAVANGVSSDDPALSMCR